MNNTIITAILNSMETDLTVKKILLCEDVDGEDIYYRFPAIARRASIEDFLELSKNVEIPKDLSIKATDNQMTIDIVESDAVHIYLDRNTRRVFIEGNEISDNRVYKLIEVARENRYLYGYWDYNVYNPYTELERYPKWQYVDYDALVRAIRDGKTFPDEGLAVVFKDTEKDPTYEIEVGPGVKYILVDWGKCWDIGVTRPTIDFVQGLPHMPACIARAVANYINSNKE